MENNIFRRTMELKEAFNYIVSKSKNKNIKLKSSELFFNEDGNVNKIIFNFLENGKFIKLENYIEINNGIEVNRFNII